MMQYWKLFYTYKVSFTCLGLYSLKKQIEDSVSRAEMIAPTALEMEEARRNKQEEVLQDHSLWDDLAKSDEFFTSLADAMKQVSDLKDLRYKVMCLMRLT